MPSLLIDDIRKVGTDAIARTSKEAFELLAQQEWTELYIDHDLGEDVTGYDIVVWMLENPAIKNPEFVQIVSSNPVGRENIAKALISYGYTRKSVIDFYLN